MTTDNWAGTLWTNPRGVLHPSRVTTPPLSYSCMSSWIGESACLYSFRMSCTVISVRMCWLGPVIERCGGDPLRSQTEKN